MKEISLIQYGLGGVGRVLVQQLLAQRAALAARYGVSLRYLALADSRNLLATGQPLDDATITQALAAKEAGQPLSARPPAPLAALLPNQPCIVVDVTAADAMETPLAAAVAAGHRVVLANKRPVTATYESFLALTAHGGTRYEATCGAGLPVISTLQSLLDSGDQLIRVEASMSGTLGFLCTALETGQPFSAAVRSARAQGFTEPDPRDDLGGTDVARKALILARTCGLRWTMADVPAEAWFPPALAQVDVETFMARLEELDADFAERIAAARAAGQVLRYVATVTPGGASVGLRALPLDHPLAGLRGPDNLFSFTTARYAERPLVVRGPGAGLAVTAAGVLADIVASAREMG
ncbi:MAG: homoserine dehydrogenase [Chloroflexaceae bacterium]|jgi:homoserine dehydrogenase|nr:homoserine dehydrogenase [Chloroflexaceae bacterium]